MLGSKLSKLLSKLSKLRGKVLYVNLMNDSRRGGGVRAEIGVIGRGVRRPRPICKRYRLDTPSTLLPSLDLRDIVAYRVQGAIALVRLPLYYIYREMRKG